MNKLALLSLLALTMAGAISTPSFAQGRWGYRGDDFFVGGNGQYDQRNGFYYGGRRQLSPYNQRYYDYPYPLRQGSDRRCSGRYCWRRYGY